MTDGEDRDVVRSQENSGSGDESLHTDESTSQRNVDTLTDDANNGNVIFDFEGHFVFPSYERDTLDWDNLSKSIGYTTEHNNNDNNGIYKFFNVFERLITSYAFAIYLTYLTNDSFKCFKKL